MKGVGGEGECEGEEVLFFFGCFVVLVGRFLFGLFASEEVKRNWRLGTVLRDVQSKVCKLCPATNRTDVDDKRWWRETWIQQLPIGRCKLKNRQVTPEKQITNSENTIWESFKVTVPSTWTETCVDNINIYICIHLYNMIQHIRCIYIYTYTLYIHIKSNF